jgi:hypothetical protein
MYATAAVATGNSKDLISAIVNLVCPECGGGMMEFRCLGRCSRDWRPEWEWTMHAIRRTDSRNHRKPPGGPRR